MNITSMYILLLYFAYKCYGFILKISYLINYIYRCFRYNFNIKKYISCVDYKSRRQNLKN